MRALVIGAGISGLGSARLLNHESYEVTLVTNRDFSSRKLCEDEGIKVVLNDRDLSLVQDYDIVVKSPGIPNDHPLVSQFDYTMDEIELASLFTSKLHYYAISGTNGKTTTVSLLHAMLLKKNNNAILAGNVGASLSETIIHDRKEKDVALEISAFQMENMRSFAPDMYGVLNLTPDHLDRFESVNEYYQAKLSILDRVGIFVRNWDDKTIVELTKDYQGSVINLSMEHQEGMDVFIKDGAVYFENTLLFVINEMLLKGKHNVLNASFAALMAYKAGVSLEEIQSTLASFGGVEHRCEFVRTINGISYYNDSKATNPESTLVCLQSFTQPTILLAGGFDKKISFDLLKPFSESLKAVYLFGESALELKAVLPQGILVDTMLDALELATQSAVVGDVVVLSPACASYDQFNNFEERGNIFKAKVNEIN